MIIDKPKVKIHKVEIPEIHLLVEYRLAYLAELNGFQDEIFSDQLKNELELYFRKSIKEGLFFALYAEQDGIILGFGGMLIKEIPGDFNKPVYLEGDILNMYTVPEARRMGVSSMILERLLVEAKLFGISKVALHTTKHGEGLYRKFGFSEPGYPYLELTLTNETFTH